MRTASLALLLGLASAGAAVAAESTLEFDKPTTAIINARHWDQTQQQWLTKPEKQGTLFFDACHRFLLMRFPGCAEAIHEKLAAGHKIASAKLVMTWVDHEFMRLTGYQHRGWALRGKPTPEWHAKAWLLRQAWTSDEKIGPTWNAYINAAVGTAGGGGYWRAGGARNPASDRYARPLGQAGLWETHPTGEIDLTAALTDPAFGPRAGDRLRRLEACGLLIHKAELYDRQYGQNGASIGNARIWIKDPKLVVTFAPAPDAKPGPLPIGINVPALAAKLAATGGDGVPTTRIPANLAQVSRRFHQKPAEVPEWMWQRVQDLRKLRTVNDLRGEFWHLLDDLESGDVERYTKAIDYLLSCPPGYFMGHSHLVYLYPLLCHADILPDVVRYHLSLYFKVRWDPPYEMTTFRHRVGYFGDMATLNHQSQCRAEAILAGEHLGYSDLTMMSRRALSLLNRQMMYDDGTVQEGGDTFYLGISLGGLQSAARFSVDPLTRLKASLGIERILFDATMTYHPGLKRRVSESSRRYRINELLLSQDAPRGVLHTLSKKGVLIETDKLALHIDPVQAARMKKHEKMTEAEKAAGEGILTLNFHACQPDRVALLAPWGADWEHNVIDNKPLPFLTVSTEYLRSLLPNPNYNVTYLGKHYGLGSCNTDVGREWPIVGVWKRDRRDVQRLADLGIMFIWSTMNGLPTVEHQRQVPVLLKRSPITGRLQYKNKMIHVAKPIERKLLGSRKGEPFTGDIRSIGSRVYIYSFAEGRTPQVYVDGRKVERFPVTAKAGQVIAIDEGVSYAGFVPLPCPNDLTRKTEVSIDWKWPLLTLENFILNTEEPLPADAEATWQAIGNATGGWIVELGDVTEHGSFEAFQQHLRAGRLTVGRQDDGDVVAVTYASGKDTLELGFRSSYFRQRKHNYISPLDVFSHQRVNGKYPYPDLGIDMDCPLGQLGRAARLAKGGAVLETIAGQPAMLRIEPISGTTEAVNPFIDPTPLKLTTPEGVVVRSVGPIGCSRITVQPKTHTLRVDYHLPPPEGDRGVERLQADMKKGLHGGPAEWEAPLTKYFRPGVDVRRARRDSARALLVTGFSKPPTVTLNGRPMPGPFPTVARDGRTWYRIPIVVAE